MKRFGSGTYPVIGVVAIFLLPFVLGTSPIAPPYHMYTVDGMITWSDGTPAADVTVFLLARTSYDSTFRVVRGFTGTGNRPIGVTDMDGRFMVSSSLDLRADSLRLGQIVTGRPMIMSDPFRPDSASARAVTGTGSSGTKTGCSGCGTEPGTFEYVVAYKYSSSLVVALPP